jgi:hypothetical protein
MIGAHDTETMEGVEMNAPTMGRRQPAGRIARLAATLCVLLAAGACDYFEVTNPGPVQDKFLDDPASHAAVVNGAARALSDALNYVAYTTAAITRELFPAGSTSSFGITPRQQQGILAYDDEHVGWTSHHQARSIAENGFERFRRVLEERGGSIDDYAPAAEIALWAGYANRLLGENFCQITIDGGPPISSAEVLGRAEQWFTTALGIAQRVGNARLANAAHAGRASVRVGLGDWAGADADALQVPRDFVFVMEYHDVELDQYNRIFWAGAGTPYRAHTVWNTVYQQYYLDTGDPRVPWEDTGLQGDAAVMDLGRVPFYRQLKYTERGADIRLSSGREMALIHAEHLLRSGDWQGAIGVINGLRADVGVAPVSAADATEAWALLKRERGIELWLEGRRMHDLRRWQAENAPGALDTLEVPGEASRLSRNRTLCYDIPKTERETNPNVPLTP